MQLTFKKEVQAWKDVLLRGSDPAALEQYSKELFAKESAVRELARTLKRQEPRLEAQSLIGQFEEAERRLGDEYAAGLESFADPRGSTPRKWT